MHALKREREALAAVEMEAGHGSRVSVSTLVACLALALARLPASTRCRRARHAA